MAVASDVSALLGRCAWAALTAMVMRTADGIAMGAQEYIMANAATVRGFSPYLAMLFNKPSNYFLHTWNGYTLDGERLPWGFHS